MKQHNTPGAPASSATPPERRDNTATCYLITGIAALTTAVGLMLCGRHSRALLVAQWVAPLLLTAANEHITRRNELAASR